MSTVRPFDAEARAKTAEWLNSWARLGPILEARRVSISCGVSTSLAFGGNDAALVMRRVNA